MTETLAALLALLALLALTHGANEHSLRSSGVAGALFGLCILCRPTFLVWFVGVVAVAVPVRTSGLRRFARHRGRWWPARRSCSRPGRFAIKSSSAGR